MATIGTMPLAFPTTKVASFISIKPMSRVALSVAPFTGKDQAQAFTGQWWEATIDFPKMVRADAEAFIAFKLKLNGPEGQFLLGDPSATTPRGSANSTPGTPLIDGASQIGTALNIKGTPAGASNYLRAGDWINYGSGLTTRMHKVVDDASSDSIGDITLNIWPALRESPVDSSTLIVTSAKGLFRLKPDTLAWDVDTALFYGLTIEAREYLF